VEIVNADNAILGAGDIRFNADGTPADDGSTLTVSITPPNGTPAFDVAFNFGAPGTFAGATSVSGTTASQLQVLRQNGVELGSITKTEFNEQGQLQITYSNGEKRTPAKLVLARFDTFDQLVALGSSHFALNGGQEPILGGALGGGMGRILGGKIEMSNVDLTDQFTNLILLQRGFQGSSQITTAANEMMQQLLAMSSGR
jgi:flagellar hook protein FlgE